MKILVAEDDSVSRRVLESSLTKLGFDVVSTTDGKVACQILQSPDAPRLALLDWMMPEMDGVDVCKAIRAIPTDSPPYIILLTAKTTKDNVVEGLESGADDYITKPFDRNELRARIQVGCRILHLQSNLSERVRQLETALAEVKQLQGLIPICSYCKKVRDDQNFWENVDTYLSTRMEARFSHGICPSCFDSIVVPELDQQQVTPLAGL